MLQEMRMRLAQAELPSTKESLRAWMRDSLKRQSLSSEAVVASLKSFLSSLNQHSSQAPIWGIFYPLTLEPQILSLLQDQEFAHYSWCWPICLSTGELKFYHWPLESLKVLLAKPERFRRLLLGTYASTMEMEGQLETMFLANLLGTQADSAGLREGWVPSQDLGGVLVPALAIDTQGYRLGRGGGYYDRFLAHYEGVKVAVVFDCQLLPQVPRDPWDQPVDWVVTEKATYWRGPKGLQADEEKRWKQ
jgi:5-formyltetrahydrofolate cyclo-ligase